MDVWRISRFAELDGQGGLKYPGRWHTAGQPIVYFADSLAAAMLETLVHLEIADDEIPLGYLALQVSVPTGVVIEELRVPEDDWQQQLAITQSIGNLWLKSNTAAIARVPSALLQDTTNFLLNPRHPDAARLKLKSKKPLRFDPRLLPRTRPT